jgi:hypothetical protein
LKIFLPLEIAKNKIISTYRDLFSVLCVF